jgi:TRAP-type C4-dicarboxylate transport system substrate-binding protein
MRASRILGAVAGALLSVSAFAQVKWDLAVVWPPGNFVTQSAVKFADRVKQVTQGQVLISVRPNGELGLKGPETMAAIRDGIVPMADYVPIQQVGEVPLMGIGSLPLLTGSYADMRILDRLTRPHIEKISEQKYNQKLLYVVPWQGHGIYSKSPMTSAADLKTLKIRTADKNGSELFKRLGATPAQLPWGETVTMLASGAINGVTTSTTSGVDGKLWEFTRHFTRINWMTPTSAVAVNLDAWKKLKPEHQAAIVKVAQEMEPEFWKVAEDVDAVNLKKLTDAGITVSEPSPEVRKMLQDAAQPMWQDWTRSVGEPAATILNQYRKNAGR